MALTHHDAAPLQNSQAVFGDPPRPYENVSATVLADTIEAMWDDEKVHGDVVGELLIRALEAEGAYGKSTS